MGRKNIHILHITTFFSALYFYHQIVTLYLLDKGLSLLEINSLFGIILITQSVFEIPTGIIADRIGRKSSIILAFAFQLMGEVEFIFATNYILFVVSTILAGIGFSFYSGCYEAMMFDSLKIDSRENEMQKVAGLNAGYKQLATVIGSLAGAFLAADLAMKSFIFTIVLTAISVAIALMVSFFMKEPKIRSDQETKNSIVIFKEGVKLLRMNSSLRRIILLSILATPFVNYLLNFYQPYFLMSDVPAVWLGLALSIASLMGFLAVRYAYMMERLFGVRYGLLISTILPGIFYLFMSFIVSPWLAVILFILSFSVMNIQSPIFADYRNRHIRSEIRATTLSVISMLSGIYVALIGLVLGRIADDSLSYAFRVMGVIIVGSVLLIRVREKHVISD